MLPFYTPTYKLQYLTFCRINALLHILLALGLEFMILLGLGQESATGKFLFRVPGKHVSI
jgi:hypothetical protein